MKCSQQFFIQSCSKLFEKENGRILFITFSFDVSWKKLMKLSSGMQPSTNIFSFPVLFENTYNVALIRRFK